MKIVDNKAGVWYQSSAQFRLVDGDNGTIFEPGEPTKAVETGWLLGQPTIQRCVDPTSSGDEAAAEAKALEAAAAARKQAQIDEDLRITAETQAAQAAAAAAEEAARAPAAPVAVEAKIALPPEGGDSK